MDIASGGLVAQSELPDKREIMSADLKLQRNNVQQKMGISRIIFEKTNGW
jgi:hypothetical protein